jgi:hypothetical protein
MLWERILFKAYAGLLRALTVIFKADFESVLELTNRVRLGFTETHTGITMVVKIADAHGDGRKWLAYKHFGFMFKKICIGYSDDATVEAMRQDAQQRIDNANQANTKPEGKP